MSVRYPKPPPGARVPLEVPPTGEGIPTPGEEPRRRGRPPGSTNRPPEPEPPPAPAPKPITEAQVLSVVAGTMQFLAMTVDESFSVYEEKNNPDGSREFVLKPHVPLAIKEMQPWMEIHGHLLLKLIPWAGLIMGASTLVGPAIDPCCEIIAGIRKPRMARTGPDDVYTDAAKRAGYGKPRPAATQTVEVASK